MPNNLSDLDDYKLVNWECKIGINAVPANQLVFPPVPDIEGVAYPGWTGVQVKVRPNQAVACTMNVTR